MSTSDEHFRRLERMYARAPINAYYNPTLRIAEGTTDLTIPVRPDFFHAAHAIHGSVYFKALDDAAFFAVSSLVEEFFVLTVSFTLYLTRPVSEGQIRAKGTVVHRSRNLWLAESVLMNDQDKQVARGSGSFVRSQIPLTADIGYV